MGVRYGQLHRATGLANLPAAAQTVINNSICLFQQTERGLVREGNDKTLDYRTARFRDWLISACGFTFLHELESIQHQQIPLLLGAFLDHVAFLPYDKKGSTPSSNTISHYLHAAAAFLRALIPAPFSIYDDSGQSRQLHPILRDRLSQAKKWQRPMRKREPFTYSMLQTLFQQVTAACSMDIRKNLGLLPTVFDAVRLGIFAGCRSSEYAQSKGKIGTVSRVPHRGPSPPLSNPSIAFIAEDFTFLDKHGHVLQHTQALHHPSKARELHLRFRHDKSGRNYTIRKFGPGHDWLCPIQAAVSILCRARLLHISPMDPICAYRSAKGSTLFLRGQDVTDVMRDICRDTYPDPNHHLRQHIRCIASHSVRITAAVALWRKQVPIDAIAFRLRWQPASVQHYIRECSQDVDEFTSSTIAGANIV